MMKPFKIDHSNSEINMLDGSTVEILRGLEHISAQIAEIQGDAECEHLAFKKIVAKRFDGKEFDAYHCPDCGLKWC